MKQYSKYLMFLAAAAMCSCSSDDSPENKGGAGIDEKSPIVFNITDNGEFISGGQSRAIFTTGNLSEISVMATNGTKRYFDCLVTRNGNGVWQTHDGFNAGLKTYYWPWSGMDVYALAGNITATGNHLIDNNCSIAFGTRDGKTFPESFNYAVENGWPVYDPMYAAAVNCKHSDDAVNLNFRHLLSRISFAVLNDNDDDAVDIHINRIAIDGINTTGTYRPAFGQNTTPGQAVSHPSYGAWSNIGTIKNCSTYEELGFHVTKRNTNVNNADPVVRSNGQLFDLLLLPQTIPSGAVIAVEYSITDTATGRVIREMGYQHVSFPGTSPEWKQNTHYVYILSIAKQIINVEILPVEWNVNPFVFWDDPITPPVQ